MNNTKICKDRIRGAVLGTAIGDALGMSAEGLSTGSIRKYYGKIIGYRAPNPKCHRFHNLKRGQWTDDTQLMLAIGESIVEYGSIHYDNIMSKHADVFPDRRGWGKATTNSVHRYMKGVGWNVAGEANAAGNGPPMKIAPIGILYGSDFIDDFEFKTIILNISRMTHLDVRAFIAAFIQAKLIGIGIKFGADNFHTKIRNVIQEAYLLEESFGSSEDMLCDKINIALELAMCNTSNVRIKKYVGVKSFVNESYAFTCAMIYKYIHDPETCLVQTINQGGDCDTTGAMVGSVLGAAHGYSVFPDRWKRGLEGKQRLINLADNLWGIVK